MSRESVFQHALAMPAEDRVQLIDSLLESLARADGADELSPEQQAELVRRLEEDRLDPKSALSWDEAHAQIDAFK